MKRLVCVLSLSILFTGLAQTARGVILPYIDDTVATGRLKDLNENFQVLYYGFDSTAAVIGTLSPGAVPSKAQMESGPHLVKDTIYFPYTELMIVNNPLNPAVKSLGFAYTREKGLLSATVRATTNWVGLKKQVESYKMKLKDETGSDQLDVKPIPVRKGSYHATIMIKEGLDWAIGNEVKNANPRASTALTVVFSKALADVVAVGLHTGAAVGFNYSYLAPMATIPYEAVVEINWKSVLKAMKTDFALRSSVTNISMSTLTRKLITSQAIKIQMSGAGGDEASQKTEAAVWDIVKIMMARTLKSNHPEINGNGPKLEAPPVNGGQSALAMGIIPSSITGGFTNGGFGLFNPGGVSGAYSMQSVDSLEQVTESFRIISSPFREIEFAAGIQIGGLCTKNPELFAYEGQNGQIQQGCATKVLPDKDKAYPNMIPAMTTVPPPKVDSVPPASTSSTADGDNEASSAIKELESQ